ncbi:hypothetical protein D3C87_1955780 [compost metagenome]
MTTGGYVEVFGQAATDLIEQKTDERLGAVDVGRRHHEIEADGPLSRHQIGNAPIAARRYFRYHGIAIKPEE